LQLSGPSVYSNREKKENKATIKATTNITAVIENNFKKHSLTSHGFYNFTPTKTS